MSTQRKCKTFVALSITIDEDTDVNDTAQLLVFIRGVNEDFQFVEGQLELVHIKEIQGLMKLFLPTRDPFKQIRPALGKKSVSVC